MGDEVQLESKVTMRNWILEGEASSQDTTKPRPNPTGTGVEDSPAGGGFPSLKRSTSGAGIDRQQIWAQAKREEVEETLTLTLNPKP